MSERTTTRASFLSLPAELRFHVYGILLGSVSLPARVQRAPVDAVAFSLADLSLRDKSPRAYTVRMIALPNGRNLWLSRGLILACRQTYDEMEAQLLRPHTEAFDTLQANFQLRHGVQLETSPLFCLADTNHITIGIPSTHIVKSVDGNPKLQINSTF